MRYQSLDEVIATKAHTVRMHIHNHRYFGDSNPITIPVFCGTDLVFNKVKERMEAEYGGLIGRMYVLEKHFNQYRQSLSN